MKKADSGSDKAARNAARILAAARSVLAQHGFAGTTISRVVAEAGVSRGLLHYHFANKEDMLARVLRTNMEASLARLKEIIALADSLAGLCRLLADSAHQTLTDDPDYARLFIEGLAVSKHSPPVRQALSGLYTAYRVMLARGLEPWLGSGADGAAAWVMALLDGLAVQMVAMPGLAVGPEIRETLTRGLMEIIASGRGGAPGATEQAPDPT